MTVSEATAFSSFDLARFVDKADGRLEAMLHSSPQESNAVRRPEEAFGRFTLVERIGSGGMATVHRAIQRGEGGFERELVVKRILPQLASEQQFVRMFIEEAKLGAHLNHPNIVQIYDLGQIKSRYFMAMEYVEGVSLLRVLRSHGPDKLLDPAVAAYVVFQICQGLHYAHGLTLDDGRPLCLVHRDVSPANVMLSTHGYVKLLDFGIAKAVGAIEREETRTGTLKGKLAYMSPEQVEGEPLTARSDIFVTGILLWEALTGRRLFKGSTDYQTLCNVVAARVPAPSSLRPELPQALDKICLRALHAKPDKRYQTSEEMADEIERLVLEGEPVGASQVAELVDQVRSTPPRKSSEDVGAIQPLPSVPTEPDPDAAPWSAGRAGRLESCESMEARPRPVGSRVIEAPPGNRWLWTAAAFVGGAMLATVVMLGVLVLSGLLKLG